MAVSMTRLLLLAATAALLVAAASAQSVCTAVLVDLAPCLGYINGNETAPPKSCCSQLASVVQSQPQCLCSALGGDPSSLGGMSINKTRALDLPKACNVQTPPVSKCNSADGANAPGAAAPTTPGVQTPGSGSKTTPTASMGNGGSSLQGSVVLVLSLAATALYAVSAV